MSWRRIWLLSLVFVALLGGATWALLQRSDAATTVVRRELQALFLPRFAVEATTLDLVRGRLEATGLRLQDPARPGSTLLAVDRVGVDAGFGAGGALVGVERVTVDGFTIECGPELPAGSTLFAPARGGPGGELPLPAIELRGGRVRCTLRAGEPPVELAEVGVVAVPVRGQRHRLQVEGSATLVELGAKIAWSGEVGTAGGPSRIVVSTRDVRVPHDLLPRLGRLLDFAPPALEVGAELRTLTVTADVPGPGAEVALSASAELGNVRASGPEVPPLISAATVTLTADSRNGGTASARVQQTTARGGLDVVATATDLASERHLEVQATGKDIVLDDDLLRALRSFKVGADIVAALQPTAGRADLGLYLRDPHLPVTTVDLDLDLREVAMSFQGFGNDVDRPAFPLPLVGARGHVRLRDDVLLLQDLQANVADGQGGGVIRLQGRYEVRTPSGEDTTLDIHADNVAFSTDLRAALTTLLDDDGALYDRLAPQGRAGIEVRVRPKSQLRGGYAVTVRPAAASVRWAGFPYRLEQVTGLVQVDDDGASFDLAGGRGDGRLHLRGFIPLADDPADAPGFSAVVDLERVALDSELGAAVAVLAPDLATAWRDSAPSGTIGGQVKVWRQHRDDPLCHDTRLQLDGVALTLPAAPWRALDLHGQLVVTGLADRTRVDFGGLRGKLDHGEGTPATLLLTGNLVRGASASEDLAFVVRDLELDRTLGQTLDELKALGADTWQALAPSGRIDLVCRHRAQADVREPLQVVVQLVDVRSDAALLPRPAEHLAGEIVIGDGDVTFDDLRGVLGGAQVQVTGGRIHERSDESTELAFTVDCKGMPIDDGIANLFSGPLRDAVLRRQLLGTADVEGLALSFVIPLTGSAAPLETTLAGQLRLYDLDVTLGEGPDSTMVHGINGVVTLAESRVSAQGGELRGALRGVALQMFGQPFEGIDGTWRADARRIALADLTSRYHGGTVRSGRAGAGIEYLLPADATPLGRLRTDLQFEQVDVATFLERLGWANPPYRGEASGTLIVDALDGGNVIDAVASGSLTIERGDLGVVPLFTAIYAQLPAADRPHFDGLRTTFRVGDRRVTFGDTTVRSSLISASGKGTMAFDGYVDIELALTSLLGNSSDPFVMPLIDVLFGQLVKFHLFGYLRDLQAEKRWPTEGAPARRQVLPMPPVLPKPTPPGF